MKYRTVGMSHPEEDCSLLKKVSSAMGVDHVDVDRVAPTTLEFSPMEMTPGKLYIKW